MGVDIPDIRCVIHVGPPSSVKAYFQQTGRAGRDGMQSSACLYYNRRDISKNRAGMQDDMRNLCLNEDICLRKLLLGAMDFEPRHEMQPLAYLLFCVQKTL
jgi:superfamily II DNA helicase RecQ